MGADATPEGVSTCEMPESISESLESLAEAREAKEAGDLAKGEWPKGCGCIGCDTPRYVEVASLFGTFRGDEDDRIMPGASARRNGEVDGPAGECGDSMGVDGVEMVSGSREMLMSMAGLWRDMG